MKKEFINLMIINFNYFNYFNYVQENFNVFHFILYFKNIIKIMIKDVKDLINIIIFNLFIIN